MTDPLNSQENLRPTPNRPQEYVRCPPSESRSVDIPENSEPSESSNNFIQNLASSHLSFKNYDRNRKFDLALRLRSHSLSQFESSSSIPKRPPKNSPTILHGAGIRGSNLMLNNVTSGPSSANTDCHDPPNDPGTLGIMTKINDVVKSPPIQSKNRNSWCTSKKSYVPFPAMPEPKLAPKVEPAPPSGMYWSTAPLSGAPHDGIRAHTSTLVGSNIYIFGGCDSRCCFNDLTVLDADAFYFSRPFVCGDGPTPLRAMTCTAVGKKLVIFGGGDGPAYYNDVYVLDTVNFRWSKPKLGGDRNPSKRRAHTACLWRSGIYIFGGGDGSQALNDIWRLDVADINTMSWKLISPPCSGLAIDKSKPKARGYHTANMVGSKLIIYGGSDGGECFQDVWIFDVETHVFTQVITPISYPRLSHTSTIVGSYLFVIGGHDGVDYSNDVLLLNLVTMLWDKRRIYGQPPQPRGYHSSVLHDSRLIVIGGFDGREVFSDVKVLELAVHAYYSQISHFRIDV
ncbi:hypothetical protein HI914_00015 [Erysiphe necator]|nr:hypothetical protein HI914_00015 [Erysiphe necator]